MSTIAGESIRDQIVNAALALFLEKGYQTTTVQDIITAANCSKGGFYHHFASKEDLLYLLIDEGITDELERIEAVLQRFNSASERLRQMIIAMVENIEQYRSQITVFFEERRRLSSEKFALVKEKRDRYEQLFRQVVAEGIQTGEFSTTTDPTIIVFAIMGMCNWTYQWLKSGKGFEAREIGNMFCDLIFQGLLSSDGLRTSSNELLQKRVV